MKQAKRNMVISLIGRPNVGKSSLFNAIMKKQHKSITFDTPGVTRDRHYGIATLDELDSDNPVEAILVDTGGFYPDRVEETEDNKDKFFNIMTSHARTAIGESDLVLMVVDVREGILPFDEIIARYIRSQDKELWVLVNKYDTDKQSGDEIDFYNLAPDEMFKVSAAHNLGLINLREILHQKAIDFSYLGHDKSNLQKGVTPREDVVARVALIGAPNAGKSTLLNLLVGSERALVSDIAGTTVDPIEGYFDLYFGDSVRELESAGPGHRGDRLLFQQYDDFRKNNPDVFRRMIESYATASEEPELYEEDDDEHCYEDSEGETSFEGEEGQTFEAQEALLFSDGSLEEGEIDEVVDFEVVAEPVIVEKASTENVNFWKTAHLVDTAGIRRKSHIQDFVEGQSVYRSLRCITESDIVLFMVDAEKGIGHQDRRLLDIALEKGKSVIVCMNKIDLMKDKLKDDKARKEWLEDLRYDVPWLTFCDILPISAKNNKGIKRLRSSIVKTIMIRKKMVATGELNRSIFQMVEKNPVIVGRGAGHRLKVKYTSQVKSAPPTFLFFTNKSKGIPDSYKRYIRNGLRQNFGFDNTPIHLIFRSGSDLEKRLRKVQKLEAKEMR
jgi:GTP-binding protein